MNRMMIRGMFALLFLLGPGIFGQRHFQHRYTYDNLGQVSRFEFFDGTAVTYEYDNEVGIATNITYHAAGVSYPFVLGCTLNESSQVEEILVEGGRVTRVYDDHKQILVHTVEMNGTELYRAENMAYNHYGGLSRLDRLDSVNATIRYEYTEQAQLRNFKLGSRTATYRYDQQGNLTSVDGFTSIDGFEVPDYDAGSDAFDERNHHRDWEYDSAGRLLRDDRLSYDYDSVGRVAMVRELATGIPLYTYLYDGAGHRVRTHDLKSGTVTYSIRESTGTLVSQWIDNPDGPDRTTHFLQHNGQVIGSMSWEEGNPTPQKTLIFNDFQGNPVVQVTGQKTIRQEYGPFGRPLKPPTARGPPGFNGHEDDASSGLTYMLARYYDPATSRFTTPDPARDYSLNLPSSSNFYLFVNNDPINFFDPDGEVQNGREWAESKAKEARRDHKRGWGYFYDGLSGFLGTAESISNVANELVHGDPSELTFGDYAGAGLNLLEVIPAFKLGKLTKIGKGGKKLASVAPTPKQVGDAAEVAVSEALNIPRNIGKGRKTIPGTGKGGYRIPDLDPDVTIKLRGSVIEVKNVKKLSITPQLRDYIEFAKKNNIVIELYSNAPKPVRGDLAEAIENGRVILKPIPE